MSEKGHNQAKLENKSTTSGYQHLSVITLKSLHTYATAEATVITKLWFEKNKEP